MFIHFDFNLRVIKIPGDFVTERLCHVIKQQHDVINLFKSLNNAMDLHEIIGNLIEIYQRVFITFFLSIPFDLTTLI